MAKFYFCGIKSFGPLFVFNLIALGYYKYFKYKRLSITLFGIEIGEEWTK